MLHRCVGDCAQCSAALGAHRGRLAAVLTELELLGGAPRQAGVPLVEAVVVKPQKHHVVVGPEVVQGAVGPVRAVAVARRRHTFEWLLSIVEARGTVGLGLTAGGAAVRHVELEFIKVRIEPAVVIEVIAPNGVVGPLPRCTPVVVVPVPVKLQVSVAVRAGVPVGT
jgi:hypothetical protein